jgi:hypothetical protein
MGNSNEMEASQTGVAIQISHTVLPATECQMASNIHINLRDS